MKRSPNSNCRTRAAFPETAMDIEPKTRPTMTRRQLFGLAARGLGAATLAPLFPPTLAFGAVVGPESGSVGLPGLPHFPAKAQRVIFLFQSGAPSQVELFDYKPRLGALHGTQLPDSVRQGPPLVGMDASAREAYTVVASPYGFKQAGQSGTWIGELLPHTAAIVDDIALVRTVRTEAVNHDPGTTFMQTGFAVAGRPSLGAWVTYGLGSRNPNLPGFVVLISKPSWNVPVGL